MASVPASTSTAGRNVAKPSLLSFAVKRRRVFPSLDTIARMAMVSKRTVSHAIAWLSLYGFLDKLRRIVRTSGLLGPRERQTSNAYVLCFPKGLGGLAVAAFKIHLSATTALSACRWDKGPISDLPHSQPQTQWWRSHVTGSVGAPHSPALLGQSFLSRLGKWSIDNERQRLVIEGTGTRNSNDRREDDLPTVLIDCRVVQCGRKLFLSGSQ
jgi:Helix-turn-helix domain